MRVLIIEDEPIIAFELQDIVQEAGYLAVGPASTLEQALAYAPLADIALVDLGLSDGRSGAALARRLIDRFHMKVIFVTGSPWGRRPRPVGIDGRYRKAVYSRPRSQHPRPRSLFAQCTLEKFGLECRVKEARGREPRRRKS